MAGAFDGIVDATSENACKNLVRQVECTTLVSPQLTTLRQPCAQIARHAVEMLIARIAAPDIPPRALSLSAPLVVRESTFGKTRRVKPKKGRGKEI
ncbi:MAG: hypothetical protein E7046_00750 [Lentisphaerae bacterium]|nr:hypothetical protein [Lentisphaerota bacterium]